MRVRQKRMKFASGGLPRIVLLVPTFIFAGLSFSVWARAQGTSEIGVVVFEDSNGNRLRDAGEKGVAGAAVSDQCMVVATDAEGRYRLSEPCDSGIVFVSVPSDFRVEGAFWHPFDTASPDSQADFALERRPGPASFSFLHASDTHVSQESVGRMRAFERVVDKARPDFVLVTGDLVRDALRVDERQAREYYELYLSEIGKIGPPVWSIPGNHENFGIERHKSLVSPDHPLYAKGMYRHYLGPTYYSFNYGGVHFVGLDTVDIADLWYFGHIDSRQMQWLRQDLEKVSPGTAVVSFNHIPFFSAISTVWGYDEASVAPTLIKIDGVNQYRHSVSNAMDVIHLLSAGHDYSLALGGHMHAREKLEYEVAGRNVRYYQTAAVVGPGGPPSMPMTSGVTLYRVRNGKIDDGEFIALDPQ